MCRIGRGVVILEVTGNTGCRSSCKTLCMTLVARQCRVPTAQRKAGGRIVVERTGLPGGFRMAGLTIGTEPGCGMHWIGRCVVIFLVAGNTSCGSSCITMRMALNAVQTHMSTFKREIRTYIVVEYRIFPVHSIMAQIAVCGQPCF